MVWLELSRHQGQKFLGVKKELYSQNSNWLRRTLKFWMPKEHLHIYIYSCCLTIDASLLQVKEWVSVFSQKDGWITKPTFYNAGVKELTFKKTKKSQILGRRCFSEGRWTIEQSPSDRFHISQQSVCCFLFFGRCFFFGGWSIYEQNSCFWGEHRVATRVEYKAFKQYKAFKPQLTTTEQ